MRVAFFLMILLCLVSLVGIGQAAIYKWVDSNGTITFRDTPPPQGIEVTEVTSNPLSNTIYDSGLPPAEETKRNVEQEAATKVSNKSFPEVELYVTSWCGYCNQAKAFLRSKGVPFSVYDVEQSSQASRRHQQLNPSGGVPVAVIGGRTIRGFSPEAYSQALGL